MGLGTHRSNVWDVVCCCMNCAALVGLSIIYGTIVLVWKEEGDAAEVHGGGLCVQSELC